MSRIAVKPSIIHVIESFGGGTLHVVATIANSQAENGWKVTIFHGKRDETPKNYRDLLDAGITLIPLKTGRAINGVLDAVDVIRVALYARRHSVDIIHGHSSKGGVIARGAGLFARSRAFYSPHGFSFLAEGGADTTRKTFLIEKMLAKLPGEIVCCSQSELEAARLLGGTSSCIENSVDAEEIRQAIAATPAGEDIDVVTVGRISDQKNPFLFAEVARRLPELKFVWVGGPVDAIDVNWPTNVQLTGWISRNEVMNLYARARVYLSTSRFEGMPIVMLEAMAAGLPIISTNVPGSKDVVRDGETGYLCDSLDGLEARLNEIINDEALACRFAMAASSTIANFYDTAVILNKWQQKYKLDFKPQADI